MVPIFSIKYEDPQYPGYICAADWDEKEGIWARTIGLRGVIEYAPPMAGLDSLSLACLLNKFGLLEWRKEIPVLDLGRVDSKMTHSFLLRNKIIEIETGEVIILRMSPAELIAKRREKETMCGLPRLEVVTDNLHIEAGKGRIFHYAEEYD